MRNKILLPTLAVAVCGFAHAALADPAYHASDIVKHFAPAPELGASRALCIGTDSECAKAIPGPAKPVSNFDLVVNFEYNSTTLTKSARQNLEEFAAALKDPRLGRSAFVVEGHTDGKGSEEFNLDLSTRRANAVVAFLREKGVDTDKLAAKGYGKLKPLSDDPFAPSNRRVETRLRGE